jgi:hypothetical protein
MSAKQSLQYTLLVAFALASAPALADGGDYALPVSYPVEEVKFEIQTCGESSLAAWFRAQMSLSDGEVSADAAPRDCRGDIFASSGEGD